MSIQQVLSKTTSTASNVLYAKSGLSQEISTEAFPFNVGMSKLYQLLLNFNCLSSDRKQCAVVAQDLVTHVESCFSGAVDLVLEQSAMTLRQLQATSSQHLQNKPLLEQTLLNDILKSLLEDRLAKIKSGEQKHPALSVKSQTALYSLAPVLAKSYPDFFNLPWLLTVMAGSRTTTPSAD